MNMNYAGYGSEEQKDKFRKLAEKCGLVGVANDTKWNELIIFIRCKEGWKPQHRNKWIDGYITPWEREWYERLPYPFVGVEWFDISTVERQFIGELLPPRMIDHSPWIIEKLESIGLDYEKRGNILRVWGYYPKSYEALE